MASTWCRFILFCMMVGAAGAAVVGGGRGRFPFSPFGRRGFNQREEDVILLIHDDSGGSTDGGGLGGGLGSLLLLSVLSKYILISSNTLEKALYFTHCTISINEYQEFYSSS